MWSSENPKADQQESSSDKQYRAPSFSWAALDNPVSFFDADQASRTNPQYIRAEVLECNLYRQTGDMFGLVRGGFLRIRGHVKELILEQGISFESSYMRDRYMRIPHPGIGSKGWLINGFAPPTSNEGWLWVTMDRVRPERMTKWQLFCLAIYTKPPGPDSPEDKKEKWEVHGLLLESTNPKIGEFRRIGIFSATGKRFDEIFLHTHELDSLIPCKEYDITSGKHTITII